MDDFVYKICPRPAWLEAVRTGALAPSEADRRDGFVHLSAAHQVRATAAKHFAGQPELVLLTVAASRAADGALRWEVSRGGDRFPHLYEPLTPAHVVRLDPLALGADGAHVFPADLDL